MVEKYKVCMRCKKRFQTRLKWQKYCSEACQKDQARDDYRTSHALSERSTATTGAISELRVCADLLEKGYEVFRAVSPSCSCDLIALKDGSARRVEVRTGVYNKAGGIGYSYTERDHGRQDLVTVVLLDGIVYFNKGTKFEPVTV